MDYGRLLAWIAVFIERISPRLWEVVLVLFGMKLEGDKRELEKAKQNAKHQEERADANLERETMLEDVRRRSDAGDVPERLRQYYDTPSKK